MASDCGTLTVSGFDPSAVSAVGCSMSPTDVQSDEEVSLSADIENPNGADAEVDIEWRDKSTGNVLKRLPNVTVSANASAETHSATVRPGNTVGTGTFDIEAVVASAQEATAFAVAPGLDVARQVAPAAVGAGALGLATVGARSLGKR